ncbi:hypothetical protein Patl1_07609 [Pistacia atlantica]|uniref:Uncharacterized protein n=1 Tax=Pistacia atlantica TaxID=434234 RepID=A0ACC1AET3_9ROSI|nr:hypothetical protein Patl1_07609 [Pistacia atlantica]
MVSVEEVCKAQRAEGIATIMAIGTINPPRIIEQSTFPDACFSVTNTEHTMYVIPLEKIFDYLISMLLQCHHEIKIIFIILISIYLYFCTLEKLVEACMYFFLCLFPFKKLRKKKK